MWSPRFHFASLVANRTFYHDLMARPRSYRVCKACMHMELQFVRTSIYEEVYPKNDPFLSMAAIISDET